MESGTNKTPSGGSDSGAMLQTSGPAVRSQFADDPEMRELVELFVSELPDRTQVLMQAFRAQQWEVIQRISHQLKGASAGYGFPTIGSAAGAVESVIKSGPIVGDAAVNKLTESVKQLISLCQRAAV